MSIMKKTVQVPVRDSAFDCDSCVNTVEQVLTATPGVTHITIDNTTDQVEIDYDSDITDPNELRKTIEEWGYSPQD